jgi:hypothetical protein
MRRAERNTDNSEWSRGGHSIENRLGLVPKLFSTPNVRPISVSIDAQDLCHADPVGPAFVFLVINNPDCR